MTLKQHEDMMAPELNGHSEPRGDSTLSPDKLTEEVFLAIPELFAGWQASALQPDEHDLDRVLADLIQSRDAADAAFAEEQRQDGPGNHAKPHPN